MIKHNRDWFSITLSQLPLLFGLLACSATMAKSVKTADQAMDLVMTSVEKNRLLNIPKACVFLMENGSTDVYWGIDVRENHTENCGGDPDTAPRLMSYEVNKKTGKLCTDSIKWAEQLNADDPYDFSCRPIK
ncbi:hypothetical protein E4T80_09975 [Muribacter muris]|uniref:Lipoprotein n=1 Tax=Muribacter muris TaxID=67855 RepID=A0A4Y9JSR0_9PAST|nr:hypothetical protein [Muribacter muris]MBF0785787.1 hypothetical protein [Muribacter muris]MBF0828241.1 hypothetical protein [Muribacter muris]TFV08608.1 hypothetical protein E4T80_09975 [Muribacter muris]